MAQQEADAVALRAEIEQEHQRVEAERLAFEAASENSRLSAEENQQLDAETRAVNLELANQHRAESDAWAAEEYANMVAEEQKISDE